MAHDDDGNDGIILILLARALLGTCVLLCIKLTVLCLDVCVCVCLSLYICMQGCGYSVIVSDMCPAVSGIGSKDAALSGELGLQALHLALGQPESDDELPGRSGGILLPGGSLVIKLLEGEESRGMYCFAPGFQLY